MNLDLPEIYNATTTFVDDNIAQGRGQRTAIYYQDQNAYLPGSLRES